MSNKHNFQLSSKKRELLEAMLQEQGMGSAALKKIPRRKNGASTPMSFAQERLWFLSQLAPESPVYNIPAGVRLAGSLDVAVLEKSLNEVVIRHEVLRTTFAKRNGGQVQIVAPSLSLKIPEIDLRALPANVREAEALRLVNENAEKPFDLSKGPLLRATVFRLEEQDYLFLITMHHIISEVWSITILFRELEVLYKALLAGRNSPLPELPIQYADFAVWQRDSFKREVLEKQLSYWREQLGGELPVLQLPTDKQRPAVQSFRGAWQSRVLPKGLTTALKNMSQGENATLFMTLLAAYSTLLNRYTEQEDIVVGSPIAGRNRAETEGLIGFFINTLALRIDLSGDPSFRKLLQRVREVALAAYSNQDLPFEKLIEEISPERDTSYTPVFQVMFALQNAPAPALGLPALKPGQPLTPSEIHNKSAKTDLALFIEDSTEGLTASFEYSTDLFEESTIARMLKHFQILLESVVAEPEQRLSSLRLLPETEREKVLVQWNETQSDYPRDESIHKLFEVQVENTPEATALVFENQRLTYQELNARANQLAHCLKKVGVGPDVLVGICLKRSVEMVVGLLSILKAGGAYVPLDPAYPKERLAFMLEDTQAPVLLTQHSLMGNFPEHKAHVICLDTDWEAIAKGAVHNPACNVINENLAYVIYTSGSTGKPKGVAIAHRNAVAMIHWASTVFAEEDLQGVLASTSICFDLSVFELFVPLSWGGKVILVENVLALPTLEAREEVNLINTVPSAMSELVQHKNIPSSVRTVNLAGEPLQPRLVDEIYGQGVERVFDLYGPSEDTTYSTYALRQRGGPATIGRPIANTKIYILDPYLHPVPVGVLGELYIGGAGVVRCYLARPELTAEKFIPNPFSEEPGARLYYTGDRARYLPDGNIEFIGRIDHQVKMRGFRIELGEIEAALIQHRAVMATVALLREDTPGDKRLVAYVVADQITPPIDELRNFLLGKLPDYMVPATFVFLDELPLTSNNKVDRAALPAPEGVRPELTATYMAPRTEIERSIAAIWQNILHLDKVGTHDNIFDLGAHSFLLTEVHSKLQFLLKKEISLIDMFKYPTVSTLAKYFSDGESTTPSLQESQERAKTRRELRKRRQPNRQQKGIERPQLRRQLDGDNLEMETEQVAINKSAVSARTGKGPKQHFGLSSKKRELLDVLLHEEGLDSASDQAIPRRGSTEPVPLSYAQERLWFLNQLAPGNPMYNIPAGVRLVGPLNVATLEKSLNEIVRRHEVLRTTFAKTENGLVQKVAQALAVKVAEINLHEIPDDEKEITALKCVNEDVQKSFDLLKGPLLRATVVKLGKQEHIFLITIHHIISEVWSIAMLFRELEVLYEAFSADKPSPLPNLSIQYADFSLWQRQWFQGEVLERQLSYWKQQLGGALPVLQIPADHPRPAVQTFQGGWQTLALSEGLSAKLKSISQDENATLFMTLLTAYSALLYRYTGQNDFVVGSPIAGRNRAETEELIGFFINTLGLRIDLAGDPSFRELLQRVREVALEAYSHQDLPFEKLIEEISPERDTSYTPVFQVMFALQNAPVPALELAGMAPGQPLDPSDVHNKSAKTDLALFVEETNEGLIASFEYSTDLFEKSTIERMLQHFQRLLESVTADPDQRLSELPVLPQAEREQILATWNNTQSDYPRDKCIHELFEAQVERTPEAVAVMFGDVYLTYRELNQKANMLAHYLQRLEVAQEELIAISMERSLDMIVGLLGILKSGGTYVPLDPTYPKERQAFMLKDIQARILLTQEKLASGLSEQNTEVICLDSGWEAISKESKINPVNEATSQNLAYVMYTSGSTGRPKGTRIAHQSVVRLVCETNYVKFGAEEVFLQLAPVSFDASTFEIWASLLNGAKLAVFPAHKPSLEELSDEIKRKQVTILWLPAGLFHQMIEKYPEGLRPVRQLLAGGDVLSISHIGKALKQLDKTQLINGYGPTENTTFTCCYSFSETDAAMTTVPIGRPIANTQIYLLDQNMEPVPIGVVGELYIGGDGLARDYLNQPSLTAERFVPNPFGNKSGTRLYKTGDLARYLQDGNVEFLGRNDNQVKVRGFRIEPAEIEASLSRHDAVQDTVVIVREDTPGDKRLVAYVVSARNKATPKSDELRHFLLDKLPEYMIPTVFVFLSGLPLTANGKVDRAALPAPEGDRPVLEEAFVAPKTEVEENIALIWQDLLQIEKVGLHDNFFDLGGHSLLLTQVQTKLQSTFDRKMSMIDMFKYPSVSSLAEYLSKDDRHEASMQQSKDRAETRRELMKRRKQDRQRTPETLNPEGIKNE